MKKARPMRDESRRVTRLGYLMGRKLFLNFFAAVIPCHGFLDPLIGDRMLLIEPSWFRVSIISAIYLLISQLI